MVALDEDALICDLAETYGIYNYRALPLQTVATLCIGLSVNSRIRMRQAGLETSFDTYLLAQAVDALNVLCWMKTKDGEKGRNRPFMISDKFRTKKPVEDTGRFADADDFEEFRARFFEPMKEGE